MAFKNQVFDNYKKVQEQLSDPEIVKDMEKLKRLSKEHDRLKILVELYEEYEKLINDEEFLLEMKEMEEIDPQEYEIMRNEIEEKIDEIYKKIILNLLPPDQIDERGIIMEIRPAAGGEEAALFARDLLRMYIRYAERKSWKVSTLDLNETDLGGIKIAVIQIKGNGVYGRLKYESGVHRVQRIPITESSGRIHTSTATVAVLPEASDVDIKIDPKDIRIDTFRASGHGGQHVNKTESAVRIVHIPTGITVVSQSERSQHRNKEIAMSILLSKLYDLKLKEERAKISSMRKSQIGTGDRSEKIRTYNYPQNRVTDHRIGYTSYRINEIMDGDLDEIIDKLIEKDTLLKIENEYKSTTK